MNNIMITTTTTTYPKKKIYLFIHLYAIIVSTNAIIKADTDTETMTNSTKDTISSVTSSSQYEDDYIVEDILNNDEDDNDDAVADDADDYNDYTDNKEEDKEDKEFVDLIQQQLENILLNNVDSSKLNMEAIDSEIFRNEPKEPLEIKCIIKTEEFLRTNSLQPQNDIVANNYRSGINFLELLNSTKEYSNILTTDIESKRIISSWSSSPVIDREQKKPSSEKKDKNSFDINDFLQSENLKIIQETGILEYASSEISTGSNSGGVSGNGDSNDKTNRQKNSKRKNEVGVYFSEGSFDRQIFYILKFFGFQESSLITEICSIDSERIKIVKLTTFAKNLSFFLIFFVLLTSLLLSSYLLVKIFVMFLTRTDNNERVFCNYCFRTTNERSDNQTTAKNISTNSIELSTYSRSNDDFVSIDLHADIYDEKETSNSTNTSMHNHPGSSSSKISSFIVNTSTQNTIDRSGILSFENRMYATLPISKNILPILKNLLVESTVDNTITIHNDTSQPISSTSSTTTTNETTPSKYYHDEFGFWIPENIRQKSLSRNEKYTKRSSSQHKKI